MQIPLEPIMRVWPCGMFQQIIHSFLAHQPRPHTPRKQTAKYGLLMLRTNLPAAGHKCRVVEPEQKIFQTHQSVCGFLQVPFPVTPIMQPIRELDAPTRQAAAKQIDQGTNSTPDVSRAQDNRRWPRSTQERNHRAEKEQRQPTDITPSFTSGGDCVHRQSG